MTSVAPIRGCTPRWQVRSMSSAACRRREPRPPPPPAAVASGNRHHRTIVVAVHGPIEQRDALHPHGVHNGVHFTGIAALGEVGHALDDGLSHRTRGLTARLFPPGIANRKLYARSLPDCTPSWRSKYAPHWPIGNRLFGLDEVDRRSNRIAGELKKTLVPR